VTDATTELASINNQTKAQFQWTVLGAGAMACLGAARLWQLTNTASVTLLLRRQSAVLEIQKTGGIRLRERVRESMAKVEAQLIEQCETTVSNLLVCTKAQDAEEAIASVAHLFTSETNIVLLQNGIKMQQRICSAYPSQRVYALSTSQGAYLQAPFDVIHAGFGQSYLGILSHHAGSQSLPAEALLHALPVQSFNIRWDANITARLWVKFAINCAINALTVIYDCKNGALLNAPERLALLQELCTEIQDILEHTAATPSIGNLFEQVEVVLLATSENISSTLQDIRKGQTSEFSHFNPYLCELARVRQRPCPVNERVISLFSDRMARSAD